MSTYERRLSVNDHGPPGPPLIPFNRASFPGSELDYLAAALAKGHISGDGQYTRDCEELLARAMGAPRALLTTSCTHALEMAALLLDIGPGMSVIVPAFTFVSTINAFVLRGATPVFADIRPDTLNVDESAVSNLISERTGAVVVVHYGGVGCSMMSILRCAEDHGVPVVEDNAHGLFGQLNDRQLGTFGILATQSFHETKNLTCGEGGALIINEPSLIHRAEIIREKGTNRTEFHRGETDKYSWLDLGSSYAPSELLAAVLLAQLEDRVVIQNRRKEIWDRYASELSTWAHEEDVGLPYIPKDCQQPYHLFYLIFPDNPRRNSFIQHMKARGILAVFHYLPLNTSPMGRAYGGYPGQCPIAEDLSGRLVRLPLFRDLSHEDQYRVIDAARSFHCG